MKRFFLLVLVVAALPSAAAGQAKTRGVLLEDLTWLEAEKALTAETVVVIPLGAASKEHGPHLKLKNDWLMAEYLSMNSRADSRRVPGGRTAAKAPSCERPRRLDRGLAIKSGR